VCGVGDLESKIHKRINVDSAAHVVVCGCEDHPLQNGVFLAFGITADDSEL
jgi:hypothetical protein